MTFLAIVDRELRVRSRSRANYWARAAVALLGILVAVPPLAFSGPFAGPQTIGRNAFTGLVSAAFILCCAACLVTADCISRERRQGTLGLLFLTRVRAYDVLAGKFVSNGLMCLLALAAFTPVLMLPVLAGGLNAGEVLRKSLVLLEVLFLALSAGLWASARGFEHTRSARSAMLLLAAVIISPELLALLVPPARVEFLSPLGTMMLASESAFRRAPGAYWVSAGVVVVVGVATLFFAALNLRRRITEQDKSTDGTPTAPLSATEVAVPPIIRCHYCGHNNNESAVHCEQCGTRLSDPLEPAAVPVKLADQPTPMHWLLRRKRSPLGLLWAAAAIGFLHYGLFGAVGRFGLGYFYGVYWAVGFVASATTGALVAWAASRFFVEARRSGSLELLLTTPVGAQTIASAQWDILKRMLRGPVLAMLIPSILQGLLMVPFSYLAGHGGDWWQFYYVGGLALGAINIALGIEALCWVALWFGYRTGVQARTVLWTVALTKAPPFALGMAVSMGFALFGFGSRSSVPSFVIGSVMPQVLNLIFYIGLIRVARGQLAHELAGVEPVSWRCTRAELGTLVQRFRNWP